jgi:hypothetical protein
MAEKKSGSPLAKALNSKKFCQIGI